MFPAMVFWLFGGLFIYVDVTGRPAFLLKYKIQDDKNAPVSSYTITLTLGLD